MTNRKIWFITGASRGMGVDFVKAALAAGHAVVGTGRDPDAVARAVGDLDDLRVVKLDVTSRADAEAAVRAAVDRFGHIDVLVNNAGTFDAGYFEELTPEQVERQLATNLVGPMNVTRAVLPVMREQRSGHIVSISSGAGLVGFEYCSAYAASKFGLEGWMESLQPEVAPFGITTTIVNPGFFRTELLTPESTAYAEPSIADYAERTAAQLAWWKAQNGQQGGDPAKLAQALVTIASEAQPPRRFFAGADVRTLKIGDVVIMPFAYSDGTCLFCHQGLHTSCLHGGFFGTDKVDGAQAEAVRVPQADGTLVVLPVGADAALMPSLLTLADVMGTGHHAARAAKVGRGNTVAVIGDGAVGLCGVIAARRLGTERIIFLGCHPDRIALAKTFGATDIVSERGEEAVGRGRAPSGRFRR